MRHPAPRVVGHINQKSAARSRGRSWVCARVHARCEIAKRKMHPGCGVRQRPPDLCTQSVACAKLPFRLPG
eukprot:380062-Lingulodinium_polyedra.AAC.1